MIRSHFNGAQSCSSRLSLTLAWICGMAVQCQRMACLGFQIVAALHAVASSA